MKIRVSTLTGRTVFTVLTAWVLANGPACRAAADAILAPGPPVLTEKTVSQVTDFFEWALNLHFSDEQRREYRAMMTASWSQPAERQAVVRLLDAVEKANQATPQKRQSVQPQMERLLLENLRSRDSDAEAKWMLTAYAEAHGSTVGAAASPGGTTAGSERLVGSWRATHTAAIQYKNSYTGTPAPTSGSSFFYEFLPDGTYRENGLLQVTTYGCTSSTYQEQTGQYRVDEKDHALYLEPKGGTVRSQVCGGSPKESAANLQPRSLTYQLENRDDQETLIVNGTSGNTRPDYFRREHPKGQ